MNKKQFLKTAASEGTKKNALISLVITIVLIVAMFFSYTSVLNTSFEKIPFIKLIASAEADDFDKEVDDLKDDIKEGIDMLEDGLDENEDELSKKELKLAKKLLKVAKKCSKAISINNIKNLADAVEKLAKEGDDVDGTDFFMGTVKEMKEVKEILSIVSGAVLGCMIFALLFSALGGFLKVKALVIVGTVFSAIYTLVFCGFLWLLVIVAINIALFIFLKKVDDDYKAYKLQYMYQGAGQFVPDQYGAPQYDPNQYAAPQYDPNQYGAQYDPNQYGTQYDPNQYPPQN